MTMASRYKKFMRLLENWPADPARGKRDFGGHLRKKIAAAFPKGETSTLSNPAECDEMYSSLHKINSDYYRQKYARTVEQRGCLGLTPAQMKYTLSEKGMKELGKGRLTRLWDFITRKKI